MNARTLCVTADSQPIGRLWMTEDDRLCFAYEATWSKRPAFVLSQALPLSEHPLIGRPVEAFFGGLLPEGDVRQAIERAFQIGQGNDFGMLVALGGDCAGAISLSLDWYRPAPASLSATLSNVELIDLIENLEQRPLGMEPGGVRISMAGAQKKLVLIHQDEQWWRPAVGRPSNCLLKPAIRDHKITGSVENEQFCMTLAQRLDLPVPDCWSLAVTPCYVVTRYDRQRDSRGSIKRIHQEDFCQALGLLSRNKYEADGGPGLADCFALVRRASRKPSDLLNLLRWVIFNVVIGNNDAHGKNLSLLYDRPGHTKPQLAPFYDLMSTLVYDRLHTDMAMAIGGKRDFRYMAWRHWLTFAKDCGLSKPLVEKELRTFPAKIFAEASFLAAEEDFAKKEIVHRILSLIVERRDRLTRMYDAHKALSATPAPTPLQ